MYKLAEHVTEETLKEEYFFQEKDGLIRGGDMGWAIKADLQTRIVDYCNPEYAKKYEGKIGGLRTFVKDLIAKGMVVEC